MSWFYLALAAPLLYAVVNLIDDNLLRHVYRSPHSGAIISGLFGGLPLLSLFFVDHGQIGLRYIFLAGIAGFLTVAFLFCYFLALDRESPSVVVALTGSSPVFLGLFAFLFLGERFTAGEFLGLALILVASLALVVSTREKTHFSRSLGPILSGTALICLTSIMLKELYDKTAFYPAYMWFSVGMMLGGLYFALVLFHSEQRQMLHDLRKSVRKYFLLFLVTELIGIAAEFTMNLAISRGPVTAIRTMEGIQPVYVLLIALVLYPFKPHLFREAAEGNLVKKFACIALIIVGLYLVQRGAHASLV